MSLSSTNSRSSTNASRKAALASWIGSAVEYYDFFIYGTAAALVFGKIFFPSFDPATATIAAFATFGVGYVTRPIGAVILGHVTDIYLTVDGHVDIFSRFVTNVQSDWYCCPNYVSGTSHAARFVCCRRTSGCKFNDAGTRASTSTCIFH